MKQVKNILLLCGILFLAMPYALTMLLNGQDVKKVDKMNEDKVHSVEVSGELNEITEIDYLIGVLANDAPLEYSYEGLKAQAVVLRTKITIKKEEEKVEDGNAKEEKDNKEEDADKWEMTYLSKEQIMVKWEKSDPVKVYNDLKKAVVETEGQVLTVDKNISIAHYMGLDGRTYEEILEFFYQNVEISGGGEKQTDQGDNIVKSNAKVETNALELMELENKEKNQ